MITGLIFLLIKIYVLQVIYVSLGLLVDAGWKKVNEKGFFKHEDKSFYYIPFFYVPSVYRYIKRIVG